MIIIESDIIILKKVAGMGGWFGDIRKGVRSRFPDDVIVCRVANKATLTLAKAP